MQKWIGLNINLIKVCRSLTSAHISQFQTISGYNLDPINPNSNFFVERSSIDTINIFNIIIDDGGTYYAIPSKHLNIEVVQSERVIEITNEVMDQIDYNFLKNLDRIAHRQALPDKDIVQEDIIPFNIQLSDRALVGEDTTGQLIEESDVGLEISATHNIQPGDVVEYEHIIDGEPHAQDLTDLQTHMCNKRKSIKGTSNTVQGQVKARKKKKKRTVNPEITALAVGDFVIVVYRGSKYPGQIIAILTDSNDYIVRCLERVNIPGSVWKWPEKQDECPYSRNDILKKIATPQPRPGSSRNLSFAIPELL